MKINLGIVRQYKKVYIEIFPKDVNFLPGTRLGALVDGCRPSSARLLKGWGFNSLFLGVA